MQRQWQVCENCVPLNVCFCVLLLVIVVVHHLYRFIRAVLAHTFHLYHLERIDGATLMYWFIMVPYPKPPFGRCKHFTHRDVEEVQGFSLDVHMVKKPVTVILFGRFLSATPKDFTTSLHGSESESHLFDGNHISPTWIFLK